MRACKRRAHCRRPASPTARSPGPITPCFTPRALLFLIGIESHAHKALVSLIGEHYVRSGRLSAAMGRLVSRLQRDREDADYAGGAVFTPDEAARTISEAERFVDAARLLIQASPTRQGNAE
ncbi:MAG: hypothetical protein DMF88_06080 [Acidobacteria bacterium]|nr:MAG: hypothetical protein DMF88_06080 [Acidobacteriota bacterium]